MSAFVRITAEATNGGGFCRGVLHGDELRLRYNKWREYEAIAEKNKAD